MNINHAKVAYMDTPAHSIEQPFGVSNGVQTFTRKQLHGTNAKIP